MIASVFVIESGKRASHPFHADGQRFTIDLTGLKARGILSADIEINFDEPIQSFKNCDYRWVNNSQPRISAAFSPKTIRLKTGFVQPSKHLGIWETTDNPNQLLWRFNPEDAAPLGVYHGHRHTRKIEQAKAVLPDFATLLFSKLNAVEFSRSPIAFSAIACFTDHCDFDTAENLALQRQLFKECGIRVTKGFFLNHHSSRADNASFENQSDELRKWREDGHELAYHSLAQAAKNDADSFEDFENFSPPFPDLTTWIDHAYQPYNLSLYANHGKADGYLENVLTEKNIRTLWNYIDSGAATAGVINQLNRDDFTLGKFLKGNSRLPLKKRIGLLIKTTMLHHYADEKTVEHYMYMAINFKKFFFRGQLRQFWPMFKNLVGLIGPLFRVLVNWNSAKNRPFPLAKFSPTVFSHQIGQTNFTIFQTLEMSDFAGALCPRNIDKLIDECGLFIAHTYFSAPNEYHHGKMFRKSDTIEPKVAANFKSLGEKIKAGQIWNPTLAELIGFLANFGNTVLDLDAGGHIIVAESSGLPYRTIT